MSSHPDPEKFPERAEALLEVPLDAASMPEALRRNDELGRDVHETYSRLTRAKDEDTTDERARAEFLAFVTGVLPRMQVLGDRMGRRMLAVEGYEPPADLRQAWAAMRDEVELFRDENVPLEAELQELGQRYDQIVGSLEVELDGESLTYEAAAAKLEEPDRALRERAFRAIDAAREGQREKLNELFVEMLDVRHRIARNAGFDDFRAYTWRQLHRSEYTPRDCLELHDAVIEEVVPRLREVYARRQEQLGVDRLRPYDLRADARGRPPLRPFTSVGELEEGLTRMFGALDPEIAAGFELLKGGWMDLEARPGKVPGLGYQSYFPRARRPYVYMSAVGTDDDVLTMRHEMGHALHTLLTQERWPLLSHMSDRAEMNELASQALELLTLPYLRAEDGGFYDDEGARRSQAALLVRALELLVQVCRIDAIQHWIYTHPGLRDGSGPTPAEIDAEWLRLAERFDLGVDHSGLERVLSRGWQYFHVFRIPFYYVEYGIAYLGALQVWERAMEDRGRALAAYREALSLGSTRPLDELYAAAGIEFRFDGELIGRLARLVERELGEEA